MKRLIILLLIVVGFAHEEMGELEKEMLYKQNDRSPLIAGLCALTPTVGHIYVGEWNKRLIPNKYWLKFTLLNPFPIYGFFWLNKEENSSWSYDENMSSAWNTSIHDEWSNRYDNMEIFTWVSLLFPFYYLQLQDAIYLAYQHNADLYEEIYGKEYIRPPKKSIIQKIIDKKEAKKTNPL